MTLTNRVSTIAADMDDGFKRNGTLHERQSQQTADLAAKMGKIEELILKLQTPTPLPRNRNPVALPEKPANAVREKSRSRKGKEIEIPSPSPAPTPASFTPTPESATHLEVPSPHSNRAPAASPPAAQMPTRPHTPSPRRAAALGPKNHIAPPPGVDDPKPPTPSDPVHNPWVQVARKNKDKPLRDDTPKTKNPPLLHDHQHGHRHAATHPRRRQTPPKPRRTDSSSLNDPSNTRSRPSTNFSYAKKLTKRSSPPARKGKPASSARPT